MGDGESSLAGRTALVTGGSKRLGRAIALGLGRQGADVAIHFLMSKSQADAVAKELESLGRRAWTVRADLADGEQTDRLWTRAVELAGPIDILINNASIFPAGGILDFSPAELERNIRINAMGPLQLCRALARQDRPGDIVNLLDARMADRDPAHAAYHLSKRMLLSITQMLALELAPAVKVNAVAPGLILPPPGQDEEYLERLASTNPLNRWGTPEEVAAAVCFLVRSDFVTGQVLFIDGGRNLKGGTRD